MFAAAQFALIGALFVVTAPATPGDAAAAPKSPGVLSAEFIYSDAPFRSCHASTIAETKTGLVTAWFGGTREGANDVGVWVSRQVGGKWTAPAEAASGVSPDGKRYPCWNPVLFQPPKGPLLLFYKVGPSPRTWWGMLIASDDGGKTWSKPRRLPDDIAGPIKNRPVMLADGTLLCGSSSEDKGWRVHMELTRDLGKTWSRTKVLNDGKTLAAIQPTILVHASGKLQILCRSRQGRIVESFSDDKGATWSEMKKSALPNPNSGVHAVTLRDGRHLLVYNHTLRGRSPLNVAVSDDGVKWKAAAVLEDTPGKYSYPTVMQTSDGKVHVVYTWKRLKVRHVVIDPAKLKLQDIAGGKWPSD
jgi:predicted neuraminidase